MTTKRDALPELSDLALIDRILVSIDNFVWARAKGITLTPQGLIGNLKQLTQCSIALRESLQKATVTVENGQLALDTISCTLNMAGYDIGAMSQFDKAHALMDMASELKARQHCSGFCVDCPNRTLCYEYVPEIDNENDVDRGKAKVWERIATRSWEQTLEKEV